LIIDLHVTEPFLDSFAVSFLITWLMIRWAPALGLVDIPSERKVHTRPIPKGGGLGIVLGWLSAALLLGLDSSELCLWGGIGLLIVVLGLVDDIRPLPWQLRLGAQMMAAVTAVWFLGGVPGSSSWVQYLLWPAAVIWIVGLTNAFNMLDNMDALSAGVAWVAAALFAITSILVTFFGSFCIHYSAFNAQLMLMGSLTGFLWFNRPPARIFMGDAGSTFLGFFFGISSLLFAGCFDYPTVSTNPNASGLPLIDTLSGGSYSSGFTLMGALFSRPWPLVFCFLFIPWYDLVSVVTIRLRQGRSPFHADKQHLSHRLVALGLSPPMAVASICLLAAAIGAAGLFLFSLVPNYGPMLTWIFAAVSWLSLTTFEFLAHRRLKASVEA
jgi:UDP-GlcNAc:undecaprenyl-phosphate GlcNAc-1-phosphate transferase